MSALIVNRQLTTDPWHWPEAREPIAALMPAVVPLARLKAERKSLAGLTDGQLGVILQPEDDPLVLADVLPSLALICVNFPSFTDGRGYSIARLIRERLGWKGELRAVGDIQRDQIPYLSRVGFNAFALKPGQDVEAVLGAFNDFSEAYQADADQPLPLFRRRAFQ